MKLYRLDFEPVFRVLGLEPLNSTDVIAHNHIHRELADLNSLLSESKILFPNLGAEVRRFGLWVLNFGVFQLRVIECQDFIYLFIQLLLT